MSFNALRGVTREIFLDKKIEEMSFVYRKAQKDLVSKLKSIDITRYEKARTEKLLAEVNYEIDKLNVYARNFSTKNIPNSYEYGLEISESKLRKLGVTRYVNFDAQIHRGAVAVLIDDLTVDLITANQTIKRNVGRYIRMTQQQIIEDKQISKLVAQGIIEGETRKEVSRRILDEFKKRLDNEQLITINGRNYQPEAYSRMVTRVRFQEASNQANINSSLQYGIDLVQVDVHSGSCDICDPFQGKIYSISGADKDFPLLEERPPYHPNCRHQLLPITRESLEANGTLENSIRFSHSPNQKVDTFKQYEEAMSV